MVEKKSNDSFIMRSMTVFIGIVLISISLYFMLLALDRLYYARDMFSYMTSLLMVIIGIVIFLSGIALIRDYIYSSVLSKE